MKILSVLVSVLATHLSTVLAQPRFTGPPTGSFWTQYPIPSGGPPGGYPTDVPITVVVTVPPAPTLTDPSRSTVVSIATATTTATSKADAVSSSSANQATVSPVDIRLASTVSQCEPFLIFYNLTSQLEANTLSLDTPDMQKIISIRFPSGIGYMEWICDIAAGYSFFVSGPVSQHYVVGPGSSSSCLRNITTTYMYAEYATTIFQSYTAQPPNTTPPSSGFHPSSIIPFPTGSFSTIIVNPDLTFALTTSTPTSSSHTVLTAAIAGAVIGGILTLVVIAVLLRKCRRSQPQKPVDSSPEHKDDSRSITSRPMLDGAGGRFSASSRPSESRTGTGLATGQPTLNTASISAVHSASLSGTVSSPDLESQTSHISPFVLDIGTTNPSSVRTIPPAKGKHDHFILPNAPHIPPQSGEPGNPQSNLATALDIISRMRPNTREREVLMASLNASLNATSTSPAQPVPRTEQQDDSRNLLTILDSFSQLDQRERNTILLTLGNLMNPDSSAGLMRGISVPPPPYGD